MPYDSITSRTDAEAGIPEDVSREFLKIVTTESAALTQFRKVPVAGKRTRFPVWSALPIAYFVDGDTGLKQTTDLAWTNKYLDIEEIAGIAPIPENVVDDLRDGANIDVWDEIKPAVTEAMGRTLDAAVFFGTNAPSSWPTNVEDAATAASNTVTEGATAAEGGFFDDVDETIGKVEDDGFDPTGIIAVRSTRGKLRRARASDGQRLDLGRVNGQLTEYDGLSVTYPMRGMFINNVRLFVGDWSQFVIGVRQDITYKILDQAVIQDNTGAIIYNLAQQDMVALRFKMRVGWQVANTINREQPTEGSRYPAAVLKTA